MQTLSANSSGSPVWAASVITGTSPAHDMRWASSKTAADAVNLWDTFTGSAFLAGIDCCVENTNRSSSEGTFLITTLGQPANSSVDSGLGWAGVMPMAIAGIARAFQLDLAPYLNDNGKHILAATENASIVNVLGQYPLLTWKDLASAQYPTPETIPIYVETVNKLIMGTGDIPTTPLFIGQGANGVPEGTPGDKPGIGAGDGVMIAGDVRALALDYCARGARVYYEQYDDLSHLSSVALWLPRSIDWIMQRFRDVPAPENCSSIAPGNPLDPVRAP